MNKGLFGVLAIMLLLGAGCSSTPSTDTTGDQAAEVTETSDLAAGTQLAGTDVDLSGDLIGGDAVAPETVDGLVEFSVTGGNFEFTPSSMTVKKGDTVRITFLNVEGFHDFVIDEFDVATAQIQGGAEEVVEFVADETGSFEYYCSVGKHREMGMKGTLIVSE